MNSEITEGLLIENVERTTAMLNALKKLGVRIALDDFGTGYSSLSYLQSFPLDRVKIDRSFVASLCRADRSLAIVRAVIGLAHGLGLPVLAEGVETNEQLRTLLREGCDEMQGYLIGRPGPIEQYADMTGRAERAGSGDPARAAVVRKMLTKSSARRGSSSAPRSRTSKARSHRSSACG